MNKYSSFAQTSDGANHIRNNIVCQDYSMAINNDNYVFAAVADGHGSPHYLRTERGSKFAVECAFDCVSEFLESLREAEEIMEDEKQRDRLLDQLWRSIVSRWHSRTEADYQQEPFTPEELDRIPEQFGFYREKYMDGDFISAYGTTLAFIVTTDEFSFCGQIGDGKCVVIDSTGIASDPVPDDPRCFDNITTSLCQEDAVLSARFVYFPKDCIPPAIFIGTDGVQNSYWNIEQLHGFYRGLALTFAEYGMTEGEQQLADFLPEMTRKGSGDDVSVAGVVDLEALKAADSALKNAVNYIAADNALEEPIPEESADDNG
jgi:hypothetical protein